MTRPWPRFLDAFIVAVFIAAITVPGMVMLVHPSTRKRTAPTGEVQASLDSMLAKADSPREVIRTAAEWFRTRFTFRDQLIELRGTIGVTELGTSTSPLVVVGDDGWLFYTGEQDLDSYRRVRSRSRQKSSRSGGPPSIAGASCAARAALA